MTCEHAQQVLLGGGSRPERLRASLHLMRCAVCRAAAHDAHAIARALAAAPAPMPPESLVAAWREGLPGSTLRRSQRGALAAVPAVWDGRRCLAVLDDPLIAPDVGRGRGVAWFADGRAITYTTTHDETVDAEGTVSGTTRLWRLDLATGEKRLLAEESGDRMLGNVEVSPAGDRLVYLDGRHLKVVDVQTGAQTEVPKSFSARRGAWSPDGARLAFTRFAPNDEFGRRGDDILADRGLWVWSLADGSLTKLLPFPDDDGRMWGPYWSPDGEWLLFAWLTEERTEQLDLFATNSEIEIIHPDGSGLRSLAALRCGSAGLGAFLLDDQCWSPDSRAFVFAWREGLGEAKWEWSAQAESWVPPEGVYADRGVVTLDIATGEMTPLVPPEALGPERPVRTPPAWSPKGNAVAFTISERPIFSNSVYVAATRDGALLPIAEGTEEVLYSGPVWSPDGESLLYLKSFRGPDRRTTRSELWLTKIGEAE